MLPPRERSIPLARVAGIAIVADPSWFLQLGLLTLVARLSLVRPVAPDLAEPVAWLAAVGLALAIVACIVVHELAHSFIARAYGLPVRRVVLFLFGGVSQIEREAPQPRAEFAIAIAGPLASVVLATSLAGVARVLNPTIQDVPGIWGWFALINLALAIFNLLPAFPMDGGRLLRSALWAGSHDRVRATRWAARAGKGFAVLMVTGGAGLFLVPLVGEAGGDPSQGVWLMLLGSFLFNAAGTAGRAEGGATPNEMRPGVGAGPDDEGPPR